MVLLIVGVSYPKELFLGSFKFLLCREVREEICNILILPSLAVLSACSAGAIAAGSNLGCGALGTTHQLGCCTSVTVVGMGGATGAAWALPCPAWLSSWGICSRVHFSSNDVSLTVVSRCAAVARIATSVYHWLPVCFHVWVFENLTSSRHAALCTCSIARLSESMRYECATRFGCGWRDACVYVWAANLPVVLWLFLLLLLLLRCCTFDKHLA